MQRVYPAPVNDSVSASVLLAFLGGLPLSQSESAFPLRIPDILIPGMVKERPGGVSCADVDAAAAVLSGLCFSPGFSCLGDPVSTVKGIVVAVWLGSAVFSKQGLRHG